MEMRPACWRPVIRRPAIRGRGIRGPGVWPPGTCCRGAAGALPVLPALAGTAAGRAAPAVRWWRPGAGACSAWRWPPARRWPGPGARWPGCRSSGSARRPRRGPGSRPGCCWSRIRARPGRRWWPRCWTAVSWCCCAPRTGRPPRCGGGWRPSCAAAAACSWWRGTGTVPRPGCSSPARNGPGSGPATGGCAPGGSRWWRTAGARRPGHGPSGCGCPARTARSASRTRSRTLAPGMRDTG